MLLLSIPQDIFPTEIKNLSYHKNGKGMLKTNVKYLVR